MLISIISPYEAFFSGHKLFTSANCKLRRVSWHVPISNIEKIYLERMITHYTCLKFYITKISLMTSNLIGFVCIHHVMIQLLDHSYHNAFLFIRYLQYILLTRFISKFCCIVSLKKIIPFIVRLSKYLSQT